MGDFMKDYRIYWIWLAEAARQGSYIAVKLINIFGNAASVYNATPEDVEREGAGELSDYELKKAKSIISDKNTDEASRILEDALKLGQRVIVPTDGDFPKSVASLRNAPLVLYVKGKLPKMNDNLCVSVVGTRTMSDSGRRNAYAIGYGLGAGGAVVVSGMALGCDGMALCGAIDAGAKTVAVLGGGVDVVYPKDHMQLYNLILKNGAVISEYPPGTRPIGYHFPVRNRIISGLCAGSVVVEAPENSGALITAKHAICQGRNVFAVPGEVGISGSGGTNALLKSGVYVATSAEDILAEYEFIYPHSVSLKACRRALRKFDAEAASSDAMARVRVSSRGGNNYYGVSAYGGKNVLFGKSEAPKTGKVKRSDKKNADNKVSMGDMAENSVKVIGEDVVPSSGTEKSRETLPSKKQRQIEAELLDEINIKVYNMMKPDVPMIPDELTEGGVAVSDVLSSLSMLELAGAVEAHPGGYFVRISEEEIVFDSSEE